MKKIKVIHPITRLILGGAQQNTMETCDHLNRDRFEASIISGPETGAEGSLIPEIRRRGIPLTLLPEIVRRPAPARDFLAVKKMAQIFKKEKPHIVHTHSSKTGILGRWAAKMAGVPVILHTVHGWGHHVYKKRLYQKLFTFLEQKSAQITDTLIVVADINARDGLKDGIGTPDQYRTIHSCIDLNTFAARSTATAEIKAALGLKPDCRIIGTVGRLSAQKNPLDFVRTAEKVKKALPNTQFLFVGDGPLRPETESRIRASGLSDDIVLTGLRTDVPELLGCMDVFILTSLWEGLPRVIPQAMACGLPVAANAVDGVCEVIEDGINGFLIPPGDTGQMAERIVRILEEDALRQRLIRKGEETAAKRFSLADMIQKLEALYEERLLIRGIQ